MHGPGSKEGKKKIQNFLQPTLVKETTKWASHWIHTKIIKKEKCNFLKAKIQEGSHNTK